MALVLIKTPGMDDHALSAEAGLILSPGDLAARGHSADGVAALVRRGELIRVRRGAYAYPEPAASPEAQHRLAVRAALAHVGNDACASHISAAVLHGLPVWRGDLWRVHLTKHREHGGRIRPGQVMHASVLREDEVITVAGMRVTSLARTVVDLARRYPGALAVAAGDAALARGLSGDELDAALDRAAGWRGIVGARRICGLLDGRSESPGESVSRLIFHDAGLPAPVLQHKITDGSATVAIVDFYWPQWRHTGEFDGMIKYGRLRRPGEDVSAVVIREKVREDAVRDLGYGMTRWITTDLDERWPLIERLRRRLRGDLAS